MRTGGCKKCSGVRICARRGLANPRQEAERVEHAALLVSLIQTGKEPPVLRLEIKMMKRVEYLESSLRAVKWKRFLRAPDSDVRRELYVPALTRARYYDRCCAYFSSRVLSVAARGFGGLIQNILESGEDEKPNPPAVRLLINEQLDAEDLNALLTTGDETPLIEKLLKQFKEPVTALEKNRLEMLSWLVASGWLEVRVALMRHTRGVSHAKFGIVTDKYGDKIAFMGSDNETGAALIENYEELEIRESWKDREFTDYYQERFENLWNDQDEAVTSISLPDAVRAKLIKFAPKNPPKEIFHDMAHLKATLVWNFIAAAPYLPNGETACDATALVELWPHQKSVIDDVSEAYPSGRLLCDEVGMGKTIEAIFILRRLLCGRGVKRILLLVPAGLLKQWQEELREKGGLLVPRWEGGSLYLPSGEAQPLDALKALEEEELLLISREWARRPDNRELILNSPKWDLVLLDEAHAARRSAPEEREFNSGNLLLQLLRELQLKRQTRGILLLSATPMQTQPWEPWDLLSVLGVGGDWMVEFNDIRTYYNAVAALDKSGIDFTVAQKVATLIVNDDEFLRLDEDLDMNNVAEIANRLVFSFGDEQKKLSEWLRRGSPLGRRMHRNTRDTLRKYYDRGLLEHRPPERDVRDELFDYSYQLERDCYNAITNYINTRYEQLEGEKKGKGFVMTIYRRRASSSPRAIRCSLERRLEGLNRGIRKEKWMNNWWESEDVNWQDLIDVDIEEEIDAALPIDPKKAQIEKEEDEALLERLSRLGSNDSKFAKFWESLQEITADGRSVLVFTEYTDTLIYLRELLRPSYGKTLGVYSGGGGQIWDGNEWKKVSKAEITEQLTRGKLRVLACTDAASEGLNLQAAGALINYDLPWNPSKVEQRIGRIDRIGQQQPLLPIRNLFLNNSVDMRVYNVLRQRCRLFEHFVGRMQPVLALARQALRGIVREEDADAILYQLEQKSAQIDEDETVSSAFAESEVSEKVEVEPVMKREDFDLALELLQEATAFSSQFRVAEVAGGTEPDATGARTRQSSAPPTDKKVGEKKWQLSGFGKQAVEITTARTVLERDKTVIPLTIASPIVEQIVNNLPMPNLSPLVLAEARLGNHRCVEALWIDGDVRGFNPRTTVTSLKQLTNLIESWDGSLAEPNDCLKAHQVAHKRAQHRVNQQAALVKFRQDTNISLQLSAAKLRLKRELGRTLRCFGIGSLNVLFKQQVQRRSEQTDRYRQALEKLGDYPVWTDTEREAIDNFVEQLPPNKQRARLLGSEINAALVDPRWEAK